jgi:hypothetical protein
MNRSDLPWIAPSALRPGLSLFPLDFRHISAEGQTKGRLSTTTKTTTTTPHTHTLGDDTAGPYDTKTTTTKREKRDAPGGGVTIWKVPSHGAGPTGRTSWTCRGSPPPPRASAVDDDDDGTTWLTDRQRPRLPPCRSRPWLDRTHLRGMTQKIINNGMCDGFPTAVFGRDLGEGERARKTLLDMVAEPRHGSRNRSGALIARRSPCPPVQEIDTRR